MPYVFTPEQRCLLALSCNVWDGREAAKITRLSLNEESITETMLLKLKLHYPGRVTIQPFSKAEEAKNGADWAWAFVSTNGLWNQPMLVQAKRLDDYDRDYDSLGRLIGKSRPPAKRQRQIDVLIRTAARLGIPPVYAFYNHIRDRTRLQQTCQTINQIGLQLDESWGITLASAHRVRATLPNQSFDKHQKHSIPFHCLLCSQATGSKGPKGSAAAAAQAIDQLTSGFDGTDPLEPRQGLSPIFQIAEEVAKISSINERDEAALRLSREFPEVAGVVILYDGEESR